MRSSGSVLIDPARDSEDAGSPKPTAGGLPIEPVDSFGPCSPPPARVSSGERKAVPLSTWAASGAVVVAGFGRAFLTLDFARALAISSISHWPGLADVAWPP
jgi:hypothetical protein